HYDETGLLLWSRNPLGGITYYYYDLELRPIYKINPVGTVEQTLYDSFNNPIATCAFAVQVPDNTRQTLTGGIITDEINTYLNGLSQQGGTQNRNTVNEYNKSNL